MMKKAIKPKLYSICCGEYTLMYECGKCGYTFNMAHNGFDYCPHCGNKIDWGVVIECNEEWKNEYLDGNLEKQKEMKDFIDKVNLTITDGQRRAMKKTQATKDAILFSNINYYLGNGWSEKELINKGFFTEEEFEKYKLRIR